jgi:HAD superfamily hydrolase (TIGR01509 family)
VFDAIFFDLDGTLIDTEAQALRSGRAAFVQVGYPEGAEILHHLVGIDEPTAAKIVQAAFPALDLAALSAAWAEEQKRLIQTEGYVLKPGVSEVLNAFAARYPMSIVTSSARDSAEVKLSRTGLLPRFRDVITRDDVSHPKPDPAPYLLAAQRLCVNAARCLVFEDSEPGAQAAFAAGMTVVQVPDVNPASGRFAHHVAPTLIEGAKWAGLWP